LFTALILFAGMAAAAEKDWTALGNAWWAHVEYLADDKLEGRGTGTEGFAKAAAYVADQFQKAGLEPAGANGGYSQPVEFDVLQLDEANSSLQITQDGTQIAFQRPRTVFSIPRPVHLRSTLPPSSLVTGSRFPKPITTTFLAAS